MYDTRFDVWSLGALIFELATTEPFVILPESGDVSSKWALMCCQMRMGRRLSHEAPIPGTEPWQDSFKSSATRQCPPCSAVFSSALGATLRWYPSDRASAAYTLAILNQFGASTAPSPTQPTLSTGPVQVEALFEPPPPHRGVPSLAPPPRSAQIPIDVATSAASRRKAPLVELRILERPPDPVIKRTRRGKCQCSGHCLIVGHRRHGCPSHNIVSTVCAECCCTVPLCVKPKNTREHCYKHNIVNAVLTWEWRITRATRGFIDALVPCDLVAYLAWFPQCREDLVKVIMLALIKEPSSIEAWAATDALEPSTRWTPERSQEFHRSLTHVAQIAHQRPPVMEWKMLSTQGVVRFMGSLKTISTFRIALPVGDWKKKKLTKKTTETAQGQSQYRSPKTSTRRIKVGGHVRSRSSAGKFARMSRPATSIGAAPELQGRRQRLRRKQPQNSEALPNRRATGETVFLGLTKRKYVLTAGDVTTVSPFLRACEGAAEDWKKCLAEVDFLRFIDHVSALVMKVAQNSGPTVERWLRIGYVAKSIVRKIAIAALFVGDAGLKVEWEEVTVVDLCRMFPDQGKHLEIFPPSWSAAELSRFVFGRPDLAILASCYACLWHDVREKFSEEKVMAAALSGSLERQAREVQKLCGHCGVPAWIVACMDLK